MSKAISAVFYAIGFSIFFGYAVHLDNPVLFALAYFPFALAVVAYTTGVFR